MTTRLLTYEDLSTIKNAEAVATLFNKLGYRASCQPTFSNRVARLYGLTTEEMKIIKGE